MKRRDVLKSLGLSLGALAISPSIASILQSCTAEKETWVPQFFNIKEGRIITQIVDIILPKTEGLPSASEVNVPRFIDTFISDVVDPKQHKLFKKGFGHGANHTYLSCQVTKRTGL